MLKEDGADKFYVGASTAVSGQTSAYTFYASSGLGLDFNTGGVGSPRMRIDSSGNVGIGDSTPIEGRLTVRSDTNSNAIFAGGQATTGQSYGVLVNAGTNTSDANFRSYDQTGSTPYFIVRGDGNVGIGTSSPSERFVVHGDGARMIVSSNDYEVAMLGRRGSSGNSLDGGYLRLRDAGVNKVVLDTNGTSWITGGDLQLGDIAETTGGGNISLTKTSSSSIISIMSRSATDGHTGMLNFYKTPATSGNYTSTTSGDVLGEIRFYGVNNSAVADIGAMIQVSQTGAFNNSVPAKMTFTTQETQRISIHADGHIGIGDNVTVSSAWSNVFGARVQLDTRGVLAATDGSMQIGHNWYYDGAGSSGYKYIASGKANRQVHVDDYISWEMEETAGTAGAEITFTERMRFTKDGKLGLNTATGNPLDNIVAVVGNGGGILLSTYWSGSATSGQKMGAIGFKGYADGNTNAAADAKIEGVAASNHSGSSAPAHLDFYTKDDSIGPGSGPTRRFRIDEYGGQIVHRSKNNWSRVQHNESQGSNIHYRLYGAGSSTTTYNLLRYRRHYWGHGSVHITLFQTYYSTTSQGEYWLLGHGRSDGSYSPSYGLDYRDIYNGPGSGRLSLNLPGGSPGNSSAEIVDVSISIPAYVYYMVKIEIAHSEFYPTTSTMSSINSYALHA